MNNKLSIDCEQLYDVFVNKSCPIIDVRTPLEYARGHIPKSLNIPLDILLKRHIIYLNRDFNYYLVCKDASRSERATNYLDAHGYHVLNVCGGIDKWKGPIEKDRGF